MKEILHKRGDTRADGFRFMCYKKDDGKFREKWASPAVYEKAVAYIKQYRRDWGKRKRAEARMAKALAQSPSHSHPPSQQPAG